MPWFYDLKETLEENKENPHFDLVEYIRQFSRKRSKEAASAVFIYNTSAIDDNLKFEPKDKSQQFAIPVIYVIKEAAKKYFSDKAATLTYKIEDRT